MAEQNGPLTTKHIVLAVTGGIAAYKAADVTSKLVQLGVTVDVVMTEGARQFVQPLTFSALTRRDVHTDPFAPWTADRAGHVSLGSAADLVLVVPATANTIARLSLGLADDLLGMIALSSPAPMLIAPAMEHGMWHHPATREHVQRLRDRGVAVVGPESGRLASGASGDGRLAPPVAIVGAVRMVLGHAGPLAGVNVVISAGGTHEPIDPVRYIGNRSSGLMGYALAQAAIDQGANVTLISGPSSLPAPYGARLVRVETALHMLDAVEDAVSGADVLIMSAAVADFRPSSQFGQKFKKAGPDAALVLDLVQNPDILATVNRPGLVKVGFAAETENLIEHATAKLDRKGLSMIIANDATATIGSPESTAVLITPGHEPEPLPTLSKDELAAVIVRRLAGLLSAAPADPDG